MTLTPYTTRGNLECSTCLQKVPGGAKGFTDGRWFYCGRCGANCGRCGANQAQAKPAPAQPAPAQPVPAQHPPIVSTSEISASISKTMKTIQQRLFYHEP